MDSTLEVGTKSKRTHSSQIYNEIAKDESKEQEIKDIEINRSCQGQLFESQQFQPQKLHQGDIDQSCKSFQGEMNDDLQKSLKEFNNNNSSVQNQQSLLQFNGNQSIINEKDIIYQFSPSFDGYQQEKNYFEAKQNYNEQQDNKKRSKRNNIQLNQLEKESSCLSDQNQSVSIFSKNNLAKSEGKSPCSSKKNVKFSNQKNSSKGLFQDEITYDKDLSKQCSRANTVPKNQNINFQENMVQQKYKQNFQKASNIISRLLNGSMNKIMRIRQKVKQFAQHLKIRYSNRRIDNLSSKEYLIINDLSHFYNQKSKDNQSIHFFNFLNSILKQSQHVNVFMPTDLFRVLWDIIQVIFTYIFYYFYSIIIFFNYEDFNSNFTQKVSLYAFIMFLLDILVNLNTAYFDKDVIIKQRRMIAKKYFLSSIFITDLVSMFVLGSKVIYSNSLISNDLHQNLFVFGLNLLIFLKVNGISNKKQRFDYIFTLTENQKHISKLINQLASVITVAHIVGYGDISATNTIEALYITIMMILFSCVFAYSINNIGFILQEIEKSSKQLNDDITTIQRYLIRKDVNIQLKSRVRHYLSFLAQEQKDRDKQQEDKILSVLSNKLREEVTKEINTKILNNYFIFSSNFSKSTLNKLIFIMKEILVNPNEVIINENECDDSSIYFIQNGIIEIYNQQASKKNTTNIINTLTSGNIFGEISFFSGLQRQASARSVNLSTLYKIKRDDFIEILKENTEDFERFKMMQDQIIFQKDTSVTRSECYNCKNSFHISNQCPRTHQYFDKQFTILKQNFSMFQERYFKQRKNNKFNAKIQKKKNVEIVYVLKDNLLKSNDENYLKFIQEESFQSDLSQSSNDNDDYDEDEDSQSMTTLQFDEKEISFRLNKKVSQGERNVDKQVKSIHHINSNLATNIDETEYLAMIENQTQNYHQNLVYENQDIPTKLKSNVVSSQARIKSFEATDIIDPNNNQDSNHFIQNKQRCNSEIQNKQRCNSESIKYIQKKDTGSEMSQQLTNLEEEGSSLENSRKIDKQKQLQQNINAQIAVYLKSQMKQGPYYNNLNKQFQKQVSNQSVDDHSLNQVQDNQIPKTNKLESSKSKTKNSSKKELTNNKSLMINQNSKEVRTSMDQQSILQNIVSLSYLQEKINSQIQPTTKVGYEINVNQEKTNKVQNSMKSIKENLNNEQKSHQLTLNKVSFNNIPRETHNKLPKNEGRNSQNYQNFNENQFLIERLSKLLQNNQLPLLLQLTQGKSFLQDTQYSQQNSMDNFDRIFNFKKYFPEYNFDKILQKLKTIQQEQKRQKKKKLTQKERRQNIGLADQIRLSVFQGTANLIIPQDYDINLYKPTHLSYGTKMLKDTKYPINKITQYCQ